MMCDVGLNDRTPLKPNCYWCCKSITVNFINHNMIPSIQQVHFVNTPDSHWSANERENGRLLTFFPIRIFHHITGITTLSLHYTVWFKESQTGCWSQDIRFSSVPIETTRALRLFYVFGEVATSLWDLTGDSGTGTELQSPYGVIDLWCIYNKASNIIYDRQELLARANILLSWEVDVKIYV